MSSGRKLIDISVALSPGTPEWPGDTPYRCGWSGKISDGSSVNVSAITASPHVGTHADAPVHVQDGWPASDSLALNSFFGTVSVVDVSSERGQISFDALSRAGVESGIERLLLKTGSSIASGKFPESWPVLSEECVTKLQGRGLVLLGVDAPSLDVRESKTLPVHRRIFSGNGCILENLDLRNTDAGTYKLIAFPQKLVGLDAAPVRAVLLVI